jgi:hypothetical protein
MNFGRMLPSTAEKTWRMLPHSHKHKLLLFLDFPWPNMPRKVSEVVENLKLNTVVMGCKRLSASISRKLKKQPWRKFSYLPKISSFSL